MALVPVFQTKDGRILAHGEYGLEIVDVRVKQPAPDRSQDFDRHDYLHRPYMPGPVGGRVYIYSGHVLAEAEIEILPAPAPWEEWLGAELQRLARARAGSKKGVA